MLYSQSDSVFKLIKLPNDTGAPMVMPGVKLNHCWKYHNGDSAQWANPVASDKNWKYIDTELDFEKLPKGTFENTAWFRLHLDVDTLLVNKNLVLMINHVGASEIYIDGKLIAKFGKIDPSDILKDEVYLPLYEPVNIRFESCKNHVIAVRYRNKNAVSDREGKLISNGGFDIKISQLNVVFGFLSGSNFFYKAIMFFYFAFFLALGILHFLFFLFYRQNKSNLYYSIFAVSFGFVFMVQALLQITNDPENLKSILGLTPYVPLIYGAALLAMLYSIFYNKILKLLWIWVALMVVCIISWELKVPLKILGGICTLFIVIEPIRIIIASIYKKKEGAWIIGTGVITTIAFFTIASVIIVTGNGDLLFNNNGWTGAITGITVLLSTVSIPLSMSAYLARQFAKTNINLQKKLIEVEDLSAKSIEQEKEKQQILADQNTTLEKQVIARTFEVVEQKKVIEEKNKDITDSIAYAKRIQDATLPSKELKYKLFPEAFVLFKPKDIVIGDFYWFMELKGTRFIAAADCTGHGVPGALVSVVCSNAINRSVKEFKITDPGKILDKVRELVLETFTSEGQDEKEKNASSVKDGMDISLCCIPPLERGDKGEKTKISWAGANNPFWYIQQNELKEIKANKQSIGKTDNPLPFTTHTLELNKGDVFYLFTDGYADQFGGPRGKKFKYKQLEESFIAIHDLPMMEQEEVLDKKFEEWKNKLAQIDDVLVIGVKI